MKPTQEQLNIINAKHSKVIVNASAGTGKTSTLIETASRVMNSEEDSLLAVFTFTKAAAEEMSERFNIIPDFIGTMHSFALKELEIMKEKNLFYPKIMDAKEIKKLLLEVYIQYHDITRNYKKDIDEIYEVLMSKEFQIRGRKRRGIELILRKYQELKIERELYDFTDSPTYLAKAIKETGYVLPYTHLFVDEIQDISEGEFDLINMFKGNVFLIGDPRQNIYQFRNSFEGIFEKFEDLGYNLFILTKNFRSKSEILDYAKAYLEPMRGSGGTVDVSGALLRTDKDILILCRYNLQVEELKNYFDNVRTIHSYKGLESDDVVLIDFEQKDQETENIYFVGVTRARNRISVISFDRALEIGRNIKYGI